MQCGVPLCSFCPLLLSTYQAQVSDPTVVPAAKPHAEGPRATRSLVCSAIGPIGVVRPWTFFSLDSTDNQSGEFLVSVTFK